MLSIRSPGVSENGDKEIYLNNHSLIRTVLIKRAF